MRFFDPTGLNYSDIGRKYNVRKSYVRKVVLRAIDQLRKSVAEQEAA